ncbi:MAG: hypothetical protein AAGD32_15610 [Planctomycetota bacterium]
MPPLAPQLIGPYFDLKLVQGLTGAIRANLLAAGGRPGPLGTVQMPRPLSADRPVDRFEPRHTVEPQPRIEPRKVHHPLAKVDVHVEPVVVHRDTPAAPKVWEALPPVQESPPIVDKSNRLESAYRPPIAGSGSLIDQFL